MPESIEPKNWPPDNPHLSILWIIKCENVATDGVLSQNFTHWPTEMHAKQLLDSAKPGHIELSDRSDTKMADDDY